MRVTLDTNCLIYLEGAGPESESLRKLVAHSLERRLTICIAAISASERMADDAYVQNYQDFADRLARLGLGSAELLLPMAYLDVCFMDRCLMCGEDMLKLEKQIHDILHPSVAFEYAAFCKENGVEAGSPSHRKWRNAKCDVQVAWSHIWHGADVLITNDRNFVKPTKLPRLLGLGAKRIIIPDEVSELLVAT